MEASVWSLSGYKRELPWYVKLKFILAENEDHICHLFRKGHSLCLSQSDT